MNHGPEHNKTLVQIGQKPKPQTEQYLLVFEQQQFVVFDLERSLLEFVPLKKLRRFFTTLQQADLHDLSLIC